jgi:hypothetical protein
MFDCHYSNFLEERFCRRILVLECGCWHWIGQLNRNGYARIWWKGKNRVAHRAVWEQMVGPIQEGLLLDHVASLCSLRSCVNPAHLEPVTPRINTLRGKAILFKKAEQYAQACIT